ncbi:pimeloyl-ACP methyl ester carboxylesterase [Rahnella sp. BIGb0236]|uniref:alpha/beta fold hydrolase n=1 Tax=Rahnella sp. BIGb0236 TaxID=2485117 RepID=UPI00105E9F16|nr:alpha/beta hydrolase [Rahnella sp. BIGb0236]TDS98030.1 pimeloyl-ACP methyl ester carboxylesterase [Rahnella sp. BIGb0236]
MFYSFFYPVLLFLSLVHQNYLRILVIMRFRPTLLMKAKIRPATHYTRACKLISLVDLYSLHVMSSYLSALYALRLFEKTRPLPYKQGEIMLLSRCVQQEIFWRKSFVKVFIYPQADPQAEKVLLLHGWDGRSIMLRQMAQRLQEKGYAVFAPDLPAHGISPGKKVSFYDLSRAVMEMENHYGHFSVIIGHSTGGLIGCMAALQGLLFKRMILIGSPCSYGKMMDRYVSNNKLPKRIAGSMKKLYKHRYGVHPDVIGPELIGSITQPVMILHDKNDLSIELDEAVILSHSLKKSELIVTEGKGHNGALRDPAVFNYISDFLRDTLHEDFSSFREPKLILRAVNNKKWHKKSF